MHTPPPDLPRLLDDLAQDASDCRADEVVRIGTFRERLAVLAKALDPDRSGGWVPLAELAERLVEVVERKGIVDAETAFEIVGDLVRKVREELVAPLPSERPAQRRMLTLDSSGASSGLSLKMKDELMGEMLVRMSLVSQADVRRALTFQREPSNTGRKLGELLIEMKLISAEALASALEVQARERGGASTTGNEDPWGLRPL